MVVKVEVAGHQEAEASPGEATQTQDEAETGTSTDISPRNQSSSLHRQEEATMLRIKMC